MITVVIPCYNDHNIVGRAVQSALKQGGGAELEVVIVDDGSDVPVVDTSGDSRVRIVRHDSNRGLPTALNTGMEAGRGDRLVILASDDELAPGYMRYMTAVDADVVSCDMSAGGQRVKAKPGSLNDLVTNNCHSYAAMFKRWVFDATGGFKATMNPSWEDWEFWLNAAKLGAEWQHVSKPLHVYHRRSDGRDAEAQTKEVLLWSKLMGYHQDLYGPGRGVVTFVVPNYAHEEYLAGAVQSALDQVYPHINVVVVNDGSPGDAEATLRDVECDRLTLLNQPNRHLSAARNVGITYALHEYQSEFLVMLDADDEVDPNFVEDALGIMQRVKEYIYTDITLIGDAYHVLPMEDWDCKKLTEKHLHPCTFLMYADMWRDVNVSRGFGYDEHMRQGWEDWEFSLAALEAGYCGRRLPGGYFHYRIHADGSMRTDAEKWSGKLSTYIKSAHPWMSDKKVVAAMCKTCGGGGRYSNVVGSSGGGSVIFVPNVGEFRPDEVLAAKYTGSTTSTMTKQGAHGQVYRYSGDPEKQPRGYGPVFTFFARDAHLFVGPFDLRRVDASLSAQLDKVKVRGPQLPSSAAGPVPGPSAPPAVDAQTSPAQPVPQHQVEVVKFSEPRRPRGDADMPVSRIPGGLTVEEAQGMLDKEAPPGMAVRGQELEPEDFTQIKGVGPIGHEALVAAGYSVYEDVSGASSTELSVVLKMTEKKADMLKANADALIAELEEEDATG